MKTIPRNLQGKVQAALKINPVVFVNGPRQAGKSTLVKKLLGAQFKAEYVSLDQATQMAAAAYSPVEFLTARKSALIIDEVQLVPELFRALKEVVDHLRTFEGKKANGHFLLTGSANILALPKLSDALVGRMSVLTLLPLSSSEAIGGQGDALSRIFNQDFTQLQNRDLSLVEAIGLATFPEISGKDEEVCYSWFEGYLTTILQRDVKNLAELEKIALLPILLRILSTRAGSLINDADISRDIGLNAVTAKFYRKILQMMFLAFDVQPWFRNIGKRLVKSAKGYMIDSLLLCHNLGYKVDTLKQNMPDVFGHVVENFVAVELLKLLSFGNFKGQLFHFRTSDGKEVDFVIEGSDGALMAIEVKSSEKISGNDFRGLRELESFVKDKFTVGIVLYSGKDVVPFGKNLWAIPFHILWQ